MYHGRLVKVLTRWKLLKLLAHVEHLCSWTCYLLNLKFNSSSYSVTLAGLTSTTYKYKTNLAPGTKILLYIADSGINEAWSNEVSAHRLSQAISNLSGTSDHYW